jgi:hypothetical protein
VEIHAPCRQATYLAQFANSSTTTLTLPGFGREAHKMMLD